MEVPGNIQYTVVYEGTPVVIPTPAPTPVPVPAPVPAAPDESFEPAPSPDVSEAESAEEPATPVQEAEPEPEQKPFSPVLQVYVIALVAAAIVFLIGAVAVPLYTIKQNKKEREANNEALEEIRRLIQMAA
jgi:hypothetical protein